MEPERPIEKLLRAWAKKRRQDAGPPLEVHPATRRLLQGEVARTLGKQTQRKGSLSSWLAAVWPRFAWGLGVFAVLAMAVWLIVPPSGGYKGEGRFARSDSRGATKLFNESASSEAQAPRADQTGNREEIATANEKETALGREMSQKPPAPTRGFSVNGVGQYEDRAGTVTLADANKKLNAPATQPQLADSFKQTREASRAQPGLGGAGPAAPAANQPAQVAESRGIVTFSAPNGQAAGPDPSGKNRDAPPPAQPAPSLGIVGFSGSGSTQRPMVAAAPAASPAPAPTARGGGAGSAQSGSRDPATTSGATASSLTPIPPASATVAGADLALAKDGSQVLQSTNAVTTLAAAAPAPTRNYFYADTVTNEGAVQRFARLDALTKAKAAVTDKSSPAKTVLASFEISRVGSEVRVVDGDGSVYTGYVQPAADLKRSRMAKAEQSAVLSESVASTGATVAHSASERRQAEAQIAQDYFFRVVGTNRTLGENVTFSGQFVAAAEVSKPATITNGVRLSGGTGRAKFQDASAAASAPRVNSSRIAGKVSIGNRSEIELNAASAGK